MRFISSAIAASLLALPLVASAAPDAKAPVKADATAPAADAAKPKHKVAKKAPKTAAPKADASKDKAAPAPATK